MCHDFVSFAGRGKAAAKTDLAETRVTSRHRGAIPCRLSVQPAGGALAKARGLRYFHNGLVGKGHMMRYTIFDTAWGPFGFVTRNGRLVETYLPQSGSRLRRAIRASWPDAVEDGDALPQFQHQVVDYFEGNPVKVTVKVDLSDVPPVRRVVLEACRRIPYGKTATYKDLARTVGRPGTARAVGGAMANNPLPLVIPCHRVLRSDGSLGGFSSPRGVKDKERLLRLENALALHT